MLHVSDTTERFPRKGQLTGDELYAYWHVPSHRPRLGCKGPAHSCAPQVAQRVEQDERARASTSERRRDNVGCVTWTGRAYPSYRQIRQTPYGGKDDPIRRGELEYDASYLHRTDAKHETFEADTLDKRFKRESADELANKDACEVSAMRWYGLHRRRDMCMKGRSG